MLLSQAGGAAALLAGSLISAGGTRWENNVKVWLDATQIYDLSRDRWRQGPPLPVKLAYGPFTQSAAGLEIYGGTDGRTVSRQIYRLDAALTRWSRAGQAPADLLLGRAVRVGGRVFLFGGCGDVADLTRCADAVWTREDGGPWKRVGALPGGAVASPAAVLHDGMVYLFGGCSMPAGNKLVNRAEAWRFDPKSLAWRPLRALPAANRGLTAVSARGRIYLFGGYTTGFTAGVWRYDPASDLYAPETPLPVAVAFMEFFTGNGHFIGAGGEDRARSRTDRTFAGVLKEDR